MQPLTRVLAPVDLESIAWEALEYAGWLAEQTGAIADLLYVIPKDADRRDELEARANNGLLWILALLTQRSSPHRDENSIVAATPSPIFVGNMLPGVATDQIVQFSERGGHDVIVMGTHNRAGLSRVAHGSVAEQVVRRANCPVLVVPGIRAQGLHEGQAMP